MDLAKEKWATFALSDLGRIITGSTPSSKHPEFFGDKYPFITPTDMTSGARHIETERYLSDDGQLNQQSRYLPKDAVCFVCIGATIGKVCMTKQASFANQQINCIITNAEKADSHFVYYLMTTQGEKVRRMAGGAATPIVNKSAFSAINVQLPALPAQHKIAAVLSAYDDLIENNTRRIKILEEMAQAIYREWFVDFRFPGHEKVKMVDSKLGKMPEGWEVVKLGQVVELAYGKALRADARQPGNVPVYGSSGVVGFHDQALAGGPGIVVGRKGNIGSVHWSEEPFYPIDTVFYVRTSLSLPYVYYNLLNQNFIAADTAVPGLSRNYAYLLPLLIPERQLLNAFSDVELSFFAQIKNLRQRSANLRATRDLLLPKLVSGEIDVSALDIQTERPGRVAANGGGPAA